MKRCAEEWKGVRDWWSIAWNGYGGWGCLIRSPYLHVSGVLSLLSFRLWDDAKWAELALQIVPSMLGFAIGGFAIFLAFGDERFRQLISGPGDNDALSPFMRVCVQFAHFITVQVGALLLAVAGLSFVAGQDGFLTLALGCVGTLAVVYSIMTGLAATMSLLRVAKMYDRMIESDKARAGAAADTPSPSEPPDHQKNNN